MKIRRAIAASVPVLLIAGMVVLAGTGCRPHNTNGDTDTATVFVTDTLSSDSMGIGIWAPETLVTSFDSLEFHQNRLRDVFFDYDCNDLNDNALDSLAWDAAYMMENPKYARLGSQLVRVQVARAISASFHSTAATKAALRRARSRGERRSWSTS